MVSHGTSLLPFLSSISQLTSKPTPDALRCPAQLRKIRVCYTTCRKHGILAAAKWLMAEGMRLQKAATELGVSHSNLVKWTAKGIGNINSLDKILKSKKKATHKGPLGQLKLLEDALLCYIFKLCKQEDIINTFTVVLRASFLLPKFCAKTFTGPCSAVKCFLIAHLFAYQMGMHTSQRPPAEVENEALNIVFGAS